ncbi:MAG TPA: glycoside hydrolase family 16 protein [Thermoleophilaceae bacterium]|nr:glycoside hydrolase family 16 protein [Thermoleophilaceae bacterium]
MGRATIILNGPSERVVASGVVSVALLVLVACGRDGSAASAVAGGNRPAAFTLGALMAPAMDTLSDGNLRLHRSSRTRPPVAGRWTLTFADEFNGLRLDLNKWRPNWLGHSDHAITKPVHRSELSCYDPAQVREGRGVLTLSLRRQACKANNGVTYAYRSGLIQSRHQYEFTYGYMEARMWLPHGTGIAVNWPAFWANGTGKWPSTGEIDVMEVLGATSVCWHLHRPGGTPGGCPGLADLDGWHTFGALWEREKITFYYDRSSVGQVTRAVPSTPMFLVANLGVSRREGGPISTPAITHIDYIRVWQQ